MTLSETKHATKYIFKKSPESAALSDCFCLEVCPENSELPQREKQAVSQPGLSIYYWWFPGLAIVTSV